MKNASLLAALVTLPAVLSASAPTERTTGILGVDAVGAGYTFYYDNGDYYDETAYKTQNFELSLNKNVLDAEKFGVDANVRLYESNNISERSIYTVDQTYGEAGATFFWKGMVSPFASASVYYVHTDVDWKDASVSDECEDTWLVEGRAGVQVALLEGLSARAYLAERHTCEANSGKNNLRYVADALYWITPRWGVSIGAMYSCYDHIDRYGFTGGAFFRF
jgi:hypothetical protein